MAKPHFISAIRGYKAQIAEKQAITTEYIQHEHERLAGIAEVKGDIRTATTNKELLGKTIGAYKDVGINLNNDIPQEPDAYKDWLCAELDRLEDGVKVVEAYAVTKPAIASRC